MIYLVAMTALAGGWTQPPGGAYTKVSLRWQEADGLFSDYRNAG